MARPRSPLLDYAVYVVVRLGVCFVQMLTDEAARGFAGLLARLAYQVDSRHRQVANDNLRHGLPHLSDRERDRLVRDCFRHFLSLIVDIARLPRKLCAGNWHDAVTYCGGDRLFDALTSGRPVMLLTGHFGNWELAGFALGLLGFRIHAIARPLDNPYVDRYLTRFREKTGQKLLAKKGDYQQITRVLQGGGALGVLVDQDAGQRGVFVDFFGRPASTHKALALMALEYDAPLLVAGVAKVSDRPVRFHVIVEEVIEPADYAARPDAVRALTQRYTAALERLIRRYPEQYFWLHRRWKHQPAARGRKAA